MSSLSILPSLFTSYFSLYKESSLLLGPLLATSLISAMVTLLSPFKSKQELMVAALVASFPLPAGGVATGGLFKVPSLIFALRNQVPNPTTNFASKEFSRVASPTTRTPSPTCKSLAVTFPPFFKILVLSVTLTFHSPLLFEITDSILKPPSSTRVILPKREITLGGIEGFS